MCKLLLMTGITEPLVAKEFMNRISVPMSRSNRDGIGYTAVKNDGSIFSERWHNNHSFMEYDSIMTPDVASQLQAFKKRLPHGALNSNYSSHGDIDMTNMTTVTMHTRFATCGKEFANTHPFIYNDVSLVHNGTIRNSISLDVNKISTCDSESALQTYINTGVSNDSSKAKAWLDMLSGSWAFGILSRNVDNKRVLDVVRGTSSLYHSQVEGLGSVFVTDKDDLVSVAKDMSLNILTEPMLLEMDSMFRFDAINGELLETIDIKPKKFVNPHYNNYSYGYSSYTSKASKSSDWSWRDDDYNMSILTSDMDSSDRIPDLMTNTGKIDYVKVKKFCTDSNESLIDRLEVFDVVYNKDLVNEYESLTEDLRDYVKEVDFLQGFKEARRLIRQLNNVKSIAR